MELGGRCLNVSLSAPPPKNLSLPEINPTTSFTYVSLLDYLSVNKLKKLMINVVCFRRTHARTQLFIPTVLQKSALPKSSEVDPSGPDSSNSKLSNKDFRNMLLGTK